LLSSEQLKVKEKYFNDSLPGTLTVLQEKHWRSWWKEQGSKLLNAEFSLSGEPF